MINVKRNAVMQTLIWLVTIGAISLIMLNGFSKVYFILLVVFVTIYTTKSRQKLMTTKQKKEKELNTTLAYDELVNDEREFAAVQLANRVSLRVNFFLLNMLAVLGFVLSSSEVAQMTYSLATVSWVLIGVAFIGQLVYLIVLFRELRD